MTPALRALPTSGLLGGIRRKARLQAPQLPQHVPHTSFVTLRLIAQDTVSIDCVPISKDETGELTLQTGGMVGRTNFYKMLRVESDIWPCLVNGRLILITYAFGFLGPL